LATPPGYGGIGIIRVSGGLSKTIAEKIVATPMQPRHAVYTPFFDANGAQIDRGIALFFPAPHSFTGEDVLELQGHGGPVVMDMLMRTALGCGARAARPGEFSERAFFNGKLDLAQAEAIHDLIFAASEQAARSAQRSLEGEFSSLITQAMDELSELRMLIEAAIDFPEEELDVVSVYQLEERMQHLQGSMESILHTARQGSVLREGVRVVIAGQPNAGKSSLLNALSGRDSAIVTDIPGTTRDILREQVSIEGVPVHIMDTAGIRDSSDVVEQEGVRRAWEAMQQADMVLLLVDDRAGLGEYERQIMDKLKDVPVLLVFNKTDISGGQIGTREHAVPALGVSIRERAGMGVLQQQILQMAGVDQQQREGVFMARERHIAAIEAALGAVCAAIASLTIVEVAAEELRRASLHLGEITGQVSSDALLGKIFGAFCIGK
jgi:tRNA modification GTPase